MMSLVINRYLMNYFYETYEKRNIVTYIYDTERICKKFEPNSVIICHICFEYQRQLDLKILLWSCLSKNWNAWLFPIILSFGCFSKMLNDWTKLNIYSIFNINLIRNYAENIDLYKSTLML